MPASVNSSPIEKSPGPGAVGVLGIPFDAFSSFMKGTAKGPDRIRRALDSGSCNLDFQDSVICGHHEHQSCRYG